MLPVPPNPIAIGPVVGEIICVNGDPRADGTAIYLATNSNDLDIYLNNTGNLTAGNYGIQTKTNGDGSATTIINSGDITVSSVCLACRN